MAREEDYPKLILPTIKKLKVGEEVRFWGKRTMVIRSTINNYQISSNRRFETRTEGYELVVKRNQDIEPNYDIPKINTRKTARSSN